MFDDATVKTLYDTYQRKSSSLVCVDEFQEDVSRILYVSRLLRKYDKRGSTNLRLLINHIIILYNVFGNDVTHVMISNINTDLHPHLYGLLSFFKRLPVDLEGLKDESIINYINKELDENGEKSYRYIHRL